MLLFIQYMISMSCCVSFKLRHKWLNVHILKCASEYINAKEMKQESQDLLYFLLDLQVCAMTLHAFTAMQQVMCHLRNLPVHS